MLESWWNDLLGAFADVPADFAFLVALPFFVVAVAFLPDLWRRHRRRSSAARSSARVTAPEHRARRA